MYNVKTFAKTFRLQSLQRQNITNTLRLESVQRHHVIQHLLNFFDILSVVTLLLRSRSSSLLFHPGLPAVAAALIFVDFGFCVRPSFYGCRLIVLLQIVLRWFTILLLFQSSKGRFSSSIFTLKGRSSEKSIFSPNFFRTSIMSHDHASICDGSIALISSYSI